MYLLFIILIYNILYFSSFFFFFYNIYNIYNNNNIHNLFILFFIFYYYCNWTLLSAFRSIKPLQASGVAFAILAADLIIPLACLGTFHERIKHSRYSLGNFDLRIFFGVYLCRLVFAFTFVARPQEIDNVMGGMPCACRRQRYRRI